MADAGHMFTDAAGIGLALVRGVAGRPASDAPDLRLHQARDRRPPRHLAVPGRPAPRAAPWPTASCGSSTATCRPRIGRSPRPSRSASASTCARSPTAPDGADGLAAVARLAGAVLDGLIGRSRSSASRGARRWPRVVRELPARTDARDRGRPAGRQLASARPRRDAGELARALADRLGGTDHAALRRRPSWRSRRVREAPAAAEPEVAAHRRAVRRLTLAIVGIGAMPTGRPRGVLVAPAPGVLDARRGRPAGRARGGRRSRRPPVRRRRTVRRAGSGRPGDRHRRRGVADDPAGRRGRRRDRQGRRDPGALASGVVRILVTDAPTARAVLEVRRLMGRLRRLGPSLITGSTGIARGDRASGRGGGCVRVFVVSRTADARPRPGRAGRRVARAGPRRT